MDTISYTCPPYCAYITYGTPLTTTDPPATISSTPSTPVASDPVLITGSLAPDPTATVTTPEPAAGSLFLIGAMLLMAGYLIRLRINRHGS